MGAAQARRRLTRATVMATTARATLSAGPADTPRVSLRQLWQAPAFVVGILALTGVCLGRPTWRDGDLRQFGHDLAEARRLVERAGGDPEEALALGASLLQRAGRYPERAGEAYFLAGSAHVRAAEQCAGSAALDHWNQARAYLQEAEQLGVSETDGARLTYRQGKALYYTGDDLHRVIEYLEGSIAAGADDPFAGYGLLAQAYLRLPVPDLQAALRANGLQLQVPRTDVEGLAPARLLRGELLLKLDRPDEARKVLANIGGGAPADVQARARYLRARSFQEEGRWGEALELWRESLDHPDAPAADPGQALYYLGVCYRRLDRPADAALAWDECTRRSRGEEATAAALGLAELRLLEKDPAAALEHFEQAVRDVQGLGDWHNTLINLPQVRELFERGCLVCRQAGKYEASVRLARLYEPLAPPGVAQEQRGRAAEEWARNRLALGGADPEESRALFRQAGEAYDKAAALAPVPTDQAERLWLAATCYVEGQDPARAVVALEQLLKLSQPPARVGEAWYLLAQAHRALQHETAALTAYGECLQYDTPLAYRARYHLARAERAAGRVDEAKEALEQNLRLLNGQTRPDDEALQDTLFELADLLLQGREYSRAAVHYEQALSKYPDHPDALAAHYRLAMCYRLLAVHPLPDVPRDPASQEHFQKEARRRLVQAAEKYEELGEFLAKRRAKAPLSADEERIALRAAFEAADCRSDLGQYAEARRMFEQLSERYKGRGEALHALAGVAQCYWREGNGPKARETVETIRQLVATMKDADFGTEAESWNRSKWEEWLKKAQ